MPNRFRALVIAAVAATAGLPFVTFTSAGQQRGQTAAPAYRAPRTPDGKPNLNGIWQAINTANYDIQMHPARPALALRPGPYGPVPAAAVLALGATGAVPPGLGVVEGGSIPYKPEAAAKK